jgi:MOSC domain-containing protein YiiM
MMLMKVVSLSVALPSMQRYDGREVLTGAAKRPVLRAMLRYENFDGDGQGDQVNHGGPEKAVCVYPQTTTRTGRGNSRESSRPA